MGNIYLPPNPPAPLRCQASHVGLGFCSNSPLMPGVPPLLAESWSLSQVLPMHLLPTSSRNQSHPNLEGPSAILRAATGHPSLPPPSSGSAHPVLRELGNWPLERESPPQSPLVMLGFAWICLSVSLSLPRGAWCVWPGWLLPRH